MTRTMYITASCVLRTAPSPRLMFGSRAKGGGQGTTPANINPAGAITGEYIDANNVLHGFVRNPDGTITKFDAPGAGTGAGQGTNPVSNNPAGAIAGYYIDANNVSHGFLRSK